MDPKTSKKRVGSFLRWLGAPGSDRYGHGVTWVAAESPRKTGPKKINWVSLGSQLQPYVYRSYIYIYMDVSKNRGTPKSSISIGFSILGVPLFLETSIYNSIYNNPMGPPCSRSYQTGNFSYPKKKSLILTGGHSKKLHSWGFFLRQLKGWIDTP